MIKMESIHTDVKGGGQQPATDHSCAETLPFRLVTGGSGGPLAGINLDRTSELLEVDEKIAFRCQRQAEHSAF